MRRFNMKIILIIFAFVVLLSGYLNVKYLNENQILLMKIQKNNINQWSELKQMTEMIEKNCIQKNYEDPKVFQLYINNICYNFNVADVQLSSYTQNLLTNIYDQLYLDICVQNSSGDNIEKYKKVFEQLNDEIGSISAAAIEYEKKGKYDNNSIYDDLLATITDCINKYQIVFSE